MKANKISIPKVDGSNLKIAIVLPHFNDSVGTKMLDSAKKELLKNKVKEKNIIVYKSFGALELPFACQKIATKKVDAIIALGAIIEGGTDHYNHVCYHTFGGLMDVQLKIDVPISFGILTCKNTTQANKRISKGADAAQAALLQVNLKA